MKIDLHNHSTFSDGRDAPGAMVAKAKSLGMGMAITDHNTILGWESAKAAGSELGVPIVLGKEIAIMDGENLMGEILALFLDSDIPYSKLSELGQLIDEIHRQDAIAAIPHPFDTTRSQGMTSIIEDAGLKIDAIEIFNGKNGEKYSPLAREYAARNGLAEIAGSDSHRADDVGRAYTSCECDSIEGFRDAIRKRRAVPLIL